jgi:hypothetical protein
MLETQTQSTADTATTLNDGRVLVTISCDVAAQVYDPASGTFGATGTMTHARAGATATLLSDGRVLIVGGSSCDTTTGGILSSAEIYDPQAGTFSATGSMSATRMRHTATLLVDGRVLVAGGVTDQPQTGGTTILAASYAAWVPAATAAGSTLATAELYDPATGTFSPTGSMADFRSAFTATRLQDGRVLVVGGGGEGYARASAEIYDPATATFSPTGSMNKKRWLMTATLLLDGRVLVAGGRSPNDAPQATAEVFDPATGQFALTGPMSDIRQQHTASLLPDGRVLIAGGWWQDGSNWNILSSTELFDPGANSFASTGSMGDARSSAVAAVLNDGRVLIMGGTGLGTEDTVALTSAVLYAP